MKITIAYIPEEEQEAIADLAALRTRHPGARLHKSDSKVPFKHFYLTTRKPGKPHNHRENG